MKDERPRDLPGLHNIVAYHEGFYSGGVPEGDAALTLLKAMGIKTIISVDGAEPDVEQAKLVGIRYIHLPIGYNGFDEKRKLELTRATRDALQDGPVYIHCHHGKHRSAGAAGAVAASLGWMTPEEAVERMKVSGTAPNYEGLYACAANATELDPKLIDAVPANFPEVSHPATFVKAMVEIDEINDHLKLIEKAGWQSPADHPDLVPAAEAGRLADLFRISAESTKAKSKPPTFLGALKQDAERIAALEAMLIAQEKYKDIKKLSDTFKQVQASCKDCHTKYRD
ncbi:MAG: cytochrome c [Phycisphaerales bacterium]|nr:cytochrome c [Phycisphaerales bacterium]